MDIKNVIQSVIPLQLRPKDSIEKNIATSSTTDRDANGQMPQKEQEQHSPMTDEQFLEAVEHLKNLAAVKEHNLIVEPGNNENQRIVFIRESNGNLFRRITEDELWALVRVSNKEKGQLLSKSA